jgi:hypothetical protein
MKRRTAARPRPPWSGPADARHPPVLLMEAAGAGRFPPERQDFSSVQQVPGALAFSLVIGISVV